jgi:hypothetical protein
VVRLTIFDALTMHQTGPGVLRYLPLSNGRCVTWGLTAVLLDRDGLPLCSCNWRCASPSVLRSYSDGRLYPFADYLGGVRECQFVPGILCVLCVWQAGMLAQHLLLLLLPPLPSPLALLTGGLDRTPSTT